MAEERSITFRASFDSSEVTEGLNEVGQSADTAKQKTSGAFQMLDQQLGGMPSKLKGLATGFTSAGGAAKAMNMVLKASPIFLLVGIIASLVQAFRASEEGQNKFNKLMAIINTTMDNLLDVFADVGEAIIWAFENPKEAVTNLKNAFFAFGDYIKTLWKTLLMPLRMEFALLKIGALEVAAATKEFFGYDATELRKELNLAKQDFEDLKTELVDNVNTLAEPFVAAVDAAKEFGEQIVEEGKEAGKVADMRAKADKIERKLLVDRAKIEAEMADARLKAREEDKYTAEERRGFLLEAQKLEDELLDREVEALELRRDAQELENTFARSNKEALDAEAQAAAAVEQVQARRLTSQRAVQREVTRLNKEIERSGKEAEKATEDAQKAEQARLDALIKANKELASTRDKQEQDLAKIFETAQENEENAVMQKYDNIALFAEEHGYTMAEVIEKQEAELQAIRDKYANAETERNKKKNDDKRKQDQAAFQSNLKMASAAFGALIALNNAFAGDTEADQKKAFDRNKKFQLGQATVQTAMAVTAALTAGGNPLKLATGAQFVEAGIAAATGAAQIATIAKTKFGGTVSAPPPGSIMSGGGQAGPQPPSVQGLGFGGTSGSSMIRSYVVGQDVTNQQQAIQLVNDQAQLNQGG